VSARGSVVAQSLRCWPRWPARRPASSCSQLGTRSSARDPGCGVHAGTCCCSVDHRANPWGVRKEDGQGEKSGRAWEDPGGRARGVRVAGSLQVRAGAQGGPREQSAPAAPCVGIPTRPLLRLCWVGTWGTWSPIPAPPSRPGRSLLLAGSQWVGTQCPVQVTTKVTIVPNPAPPWTPSWGSPHANYPILVLLTQAQHPLL
jgi:hypothetical protein